MIERWRMRFQVKETLDFTWFSLKDMVSGVTSCGKASVRPGM